METVTLARNAMNTRFELVLHGRNPVSLRAAGEEALDEIERIENQLSLFRPASEIAQVNARAAQGPVQVSPGVFALLARAQRLGVETDGAFDITLAPLLHCWGLLGRHEGRVPDAAELAAARARCGMELVELNPARFTVRFAREGVMLDLGAIGKGHAIEQAAECLREAGVSSALLHGGTSTVYALGAPPNSEAWKIAIDAPSAQVLGPAFARALELPEGGTTSPLATIPLRDESLSVSAVAGKCFVADGRTLGHVIDPRTGEPAGNALLAAVVLPSATESDALSTALLVTGAQGLEGIAALRPGMRTLVARAEAGDLRCVARGIELNRPPAVG
jgi:thiamine biosynthesis lipoprotein